MFAEVNDEEDVEIGAHAVFGINRGGSSMQSLC